MDPHTYHLETSEPGSHLSPEIRRLMYLLRMHDGDVEAARADWPRFVAAQPSIRREYEEGAI